MPGGLRYIGVPLSNPAHIGVKSIADAAEAQGVSETSVDSQISSALTGYATQSYVDQQDALRASTSYVDQKDALKVRLARRGAVNGVATLDSTGRIPASQLPTTLSARGPGWVYSAGNFASGNIQVTSTSQFQLLARMTVTSTAYNAGISFQPFFWGNWECRGVSGTGRPTIEVRYGGTTGVIVAKGQGSSRGNYHACNVFPYPAQTIAPASSHIFYVYGRNTSTGTIEFSGKNGPNGTPADPFLSCLMQPAYGAT